MFTKRMTKLLLLLAAFALFAAACGGDDDGDGDAVATEETEAPAAAAPADDDMADEDMADDDMADEDMADEDMADDDMADDDMADEDMADEMSMTPGDGVSVLAGRANWSSGYFQAELYKLLLEELGYEVSDPAELELGPSNGYTAMALGEMDYWPNSWYPGHLSWLENELPDGSLVKEHVTIVGEEMLGSGLQGFMVTKAFADEHGVYTMDELNRNPDALAAFDAEDADPGNGVADIFGCPEDWTCDDIIESQIAFSGWDNIQQVKAGYDAMFAQAVDNADDGKAMVMYTWTPTAYLTQLRPGDNVYWMGVESVIDDSNPLGLEGGEQWSQLGPAGTPVNAPIGEDACPSVATSADGLCQLGWIAADIQVTARNDFLAANPAAEALFDAVTLSAIDVALAHFDQTAGTPPRDVAIAWIANNRATVDAWLDAARAAA